MVCVSVEAMSIKTQILCFFVLLSILWDTAQSANNINIALDCGSSEAVTDSDNRKWEPDMKYLRSDKSIQSAASYQDPSLSSQVPYLTARIFKTPGKYEIPVSPGNRHFVRLHFYPSTYTGLNIMESYFSVTANDITLLSNFSAAITCQALTQAYLIREYSLAPSNSDVLTLMFNPSDKQPNAFAFINGIEVIQMPGLFESANLIGFSDQTVDASTANLQTMFRLNVGGQNIPGSQDSGGLMRTWYDDAPYIFSAGMGVNLEAGKNFKINYKDLLESSAPVNVYKTARSQGPEPEVNVKSNLTWTFQIDAKFTYIIRLHFCEFRLSKVNQRAFNIYINNKTAQADPSAADIIGWTGEKGVPIYKDYAIFVDRNNGNEEIWLQMTPSTLSKPEYLDSQLNGLEIFKLDMEKNLAGLNPQPSSAQMNQQVRRHFKNNRNNAVIMGSTGGAAALVFCVVCFVVYQRKRRFPGSDSHTTSWLPIYGNSHTTGSKSTISGKSNNGSHLSNLAGGLCRRFSITEIKQGTKNFHESNVIGVGGFGKVYKGVIDGGTNVAIKRSNPDSEQGLNEFETEIELLSRLRHKHLVSLIGFCEEEGEMCLIYDYMALGTLREHLYNSKKPPLSWKRRLEICIGAARGLHYLHTGAKYTIIHRDVKTTNILLDENWIAKVSDFGLSKTGPNMANGHVTTVVKGSFGYLDPEYFRRQQLTEKSDVYSFGVVLFEVLCARPALNPNLTKEQVSLADWALNCKHRGALEEIIDPFLKDQINHECLQKFIDTAEKCLADVGLDRPTMGDVLWNLEFALQLQEAANVAKHKSGPTHGGAGGSAGVLNHLSIGSEPELSDQSSNDSNDSPIFSQMVNPKGR